MPKLIAMMPIRDEDWILERSLADLSTYVDEIVVVDDGSIDQTPEIIRSFPKVTLIHTNPPGTKPFCNGQESTNRNRLLDMARQRGAEWILQIDADEIFEDAMKTRIHRFFRKGCSVQFHIVNLWGDIDHFRVDGEWAEFHRWSLFRLHGRYASNLRYSTNSLIAKPRSYDRRNIFKSDLKIVHFGWTNPNIRIKHLLRYFEVYKIKHPEKTVSFEEFSVNEEMQTELKIIKQDESKVITKTWKEIMGSESQEKYRI